MLELITQLDGFDSRGNIKVMFATNRLNPEKGRTPEEKEGLRVKYTPGDNVLPKVEAREMSLRERRIEDADRRLMNEVRDLSLVEVGVESEAARRERRRREDARRHRAP